MDIQKQHRINVLLLNALVFTVVCFMPYSAHGDERLFLNTCDVQCQQIFKIEKTAIEFAASANNNDYESMAKLFDFEHMLSHIQSALPDSLQSRKVIGEFRQWGPSVLLKRLLQEYSAPDTEILYMRLITKEDDIQPVVRVVMADGGAEYFILDMNEQGSTVESIYVLSTGKLLSDILIEALALVMDDKSLSFAKLFGIKSVNKGLLKALGEVESFEKNQQFKEARDVLKRLPEDIQNSQLILMRTMAISAHLDESIYFADLAKLDELYGDKKELQFMLIDHHFTVGNYDKALSSVDAVIEKLGADGYLYDLKASILYSAGRLALASEYAKKAIDAEYDLENGYWTLTVIHAESGEYVELVNILNLLTDLFTYEFSANYFNEQDTYVGFVKSKVYEDWITKWNEADTAI